MFSLDLGWPLGLGVVAAFNPCGFAMLPAYVSFFVGQDDEEADVSLPRSIARALKVGFVLTLGFVFVFGTLGILTNTLISSSDVSSRIGYATVTFGVLLVPLGIAMLRGFEPKLNIPRLNKGGKDTGLVSIFLFGVSYAVVSVSCTIGLFLSVVAGSFTSEGFFGGVLYFVAYAAGMGAVMLALTLAVALARNSVASNMRRLLPYINRVSGVLLFLAGFFLVNYGIWQIRVSRGNPNAAAYGVDQADAAAARLAQWANDVGPNRLAMAAFVLIIGAIILALSGSLTQRRDKALLVGGFAALYGFLEIFRYDFDLLFLPILRTIADFPERIANWFLDPIRWPVIPELLLATVIAGIIYLSIRSRFVTEDEDAGKTLASV